MANTGEENSDLPMHPALPGSENNEDSDNTLSETNDGSHDIQNGEEKGKGKRTKKTPNPDASGSGTALAQDQQRLKKVPTSPLPKKATAASNAKEISGIKSQLRGVSSLLETLIAQNVLQGRPDTQRGQHYPRSMTRRADGVSDDYGHVMHYSQPRPVSHVHHGEERRTRSTGRTPYHHTEEARTGSLDKDHSYLDLGRDYWDEPQNLAELTKDDELQRSPCI